LNTLYKIKDLDELDNLCAELKKNILLKSKEFKNQVFFLEAQMGSGKTTFTRKLIQKFNNNLRVTSPTFTGMHLYEGLNFDFYHYDLYQVGLNLEEFEDILGDEKKKLIFFEWAENLDDEIKNTFTNPETLIQTIKINVLENEERVFTIN
jgi:tRNA threonylcarbamoyladenosine biosynthesis protein TsaE